MFVGTLLPIRVFSSCRWTCRCEIYSGRRDAMPGSSFRMATCQAGEVDIFWSWITMSKFWVSQSCCSARHILQWLKSHAELQRLSSKKSPARFLQAFVDFARYISESCSQLGLARPLAMAWRRDPREFAGEENQQVPFTYHFRCESWEPPLRGSCKRVVRGSCCFSWYLNVLQVGQAFHPSLWVGLGWVRSLIGWLHRCVLRRPPQQVLLGLWPSTQVMSSGRPRKYSDGHKILLTDT